MRFADKFQHSSSCLWIIATIQLMLSRTNAATRFCLRKILWQQFHCCYDIFRQEEEKFILIDLTRTLHFFHSLWFNSVVGSLCSLWISPSSFGVVDSALNCAETIYSHHQVQVGNKVLCWFCIFHLIPIILSVSFCFHSFHFWEICPWNFVKSILRRLRPSDDKSIVKVFESGSTGKYERLKS